MQSCPDGTEGKCAQHCLIACNMVEELSSKCYSSIYLLVLLWNVLLIAILRNHNYAFTTAWNVQANTNRVDISKTRIYGLPRNYWCLFYLEQYLINAQSLSANYAVCHSSIVNRVCATRAHVLLSEWTHLRRIHMWRTVSSLYECIFRLCPDVSFNK